MSHKSPDRFKLDILKAGVPLLPILVRVFPLVQGRPGVLAVLGLAALVVEPEGSEGLQLTINNYT